MKEQDKDSEDNISESLPRADDTLDAYGSRYRRLFESAQEGILILDFDTSQILDVNPHLIDMLGYSHEEFLKKVSLGGRSIQRSCSEQGDSLNGVHRAFSLE